ncbi:hypothetical protein SLE2022_184320 [Rubroshorea leprosula]
MAGPDTLLQGMDTTKFVLILASQGVDFLLAPEGKVPLTRLDGRRVCLFFSANWCRPCRTFVPQLVQLYESLRTRGKELEIVFVSFDQDENRFNQHFHCMPWLAVPFNETLLKNLRDSYQVDRIPSLIPLSSDGIPVEEDLIGLIEDYGAEAYPFTWKRREELKAADDAKRRGVKLEELLSQEDRDYVVSRDSGKVPISQLVGKTIGLYFGAHWCPPCRTFTLQLVEAYNELISNGAQSFEVILVSTDRDQKEFDLNLSSMPWLAIPFEDRTRQDLCRIFNIKAIPELALIGPDGKTITTKGKNMISLYGANSFPFTESRIAEIETSLKKEGDALPQQVKDTKHEHMLKLDMAKAYLCDSCKKQGRFWAFSCDLCDYDLHPSCLELKET